MRKLLLLIFILPLFSSKCEDNPKPIVCEGVLSLNIKPTINNQPFVSNKVYTINGKKVRFSKFQFYASVATFSSVNSTLDCNDDSNILFLDFTQLDDSIKSSKGITTEPSKVGIGNFGILTIGLGVTANLNVKTPSDFPSTNPLSKSEEYWSSWKSYIFFKLEGLMDKDDNGSFETGITYHTGSDFVNLPKSIAKDFEVNKFGTMLNLDLDMNKLLTGFDFTTLNKIENLNQKEDMRKLMTNLASAIAIK
jgi:hypothetical protein